MVFMFFDAADHPLFMRSDAETATWTVHELTLQATFPYLPDKALQRGQRIGFTDETGVFQPFEIRKVRTYPADGYQEITAEHIAVAELSDEHLAKAELMGMGPSAALAQILDGTLWSVGTVVTEDDYLTVNYTLKSGVIARDGSVNALGVRAEVVVRPGEIYKISGYVYNNVYPLVYMTKDSVSTENIVTVSDTASGVITDYEATVPMGANLMVINARSAADLSVQRNLHSSAEISMGSVWQGVRTIESSWNVYITPRVTVGAAGITGRYLDITPATPTWRGIRLSLDKNLDELGVTWDDTNVLTALYGYGKGSGDDPLTFADVVWAATADHPAKPNGQTYLEDPAATALYGRNGRPRFGYYQNGNIGDADLLLQKTWEALQATNAPEISIDCAVVDLYRLGYADQPIRLHDLALIYERSTGQTYQREIIQLEVDLLNPQNTRPVIGAYIPNIVYIEKESSGRGGGGGGGGGRGQTPLEDVISEFETEILANQYEISLRAYQRDMDTVDSILRQAGISLDANGVLIYADDNENMWASKLNVQADRISLVVEGTGSNAHIKAAQIVTAINSQTGQSVIKLSADVIDLDGYVTASELAAIQAEITNLMAGDLTATHIRTGSMTATNTYTSSLRLGGYSASWKSVTVMGSDGATTVTLRYVGRD